MTRSIKRKAERRARRSIRIKPFARHTQYIFAAALALWLPTSYAAVLVDLDATSLAEGVLNTWTNKGTVVGNFTAPTGGVPSVAKVQGVKGVTFNGTTQYYTGPAAPAEVTGAGSRTIEAWVLNPTIADEETIFAWGRRGGGDGSNTSFNHGLNPTFGAVGHWGAPDVGWNGQIASNRWTYVAYTYDGTTAKVYFDGVLANSKDVFLSTWDVDNTAAANPLPFRVASQNEANGTATGTLRGSMTIAKIRVHDTPLDAATLKANFDSQSVAFGLGDQDNDGLPTFYENQFPTFLNPLDASDAAKDQDNDGLTNLKEYQLKTAPDKADTDGDGVNDGAEVNRTVGGTAAATNPLAADTDGDGLSDKAESGTGTFVNAANTGTDPLKADSDGDGFSDLQEVAAGSDPNKASSIPSDNRPAIITLDASNLVPGVVNTWTNTGTLGGVFAGSGAPRVSRIQGVNAISFNGTSQYYTGPTTPGFITGNASRTVEAWILNPTAADEETIFSWGRRGGPDGSNTSFNHGLNFNFGAVGHWGSPDIGWNGTVNQGLWTYVVYTYDGVAQTTHVYADGVEVNTETLPAPLNTWALDNLGRPLPFRVASQNEANGSPTTALRGSMSIAEIHVYDRALDPSVVSANFKAGQDKYGLVDYDNDGLPTWYERQYGFPERTANGNEDPDGDGLTNLQEFQGGTNPTIADTDGDGVSDGAEVKRAAGATNPLLADSDQDGISDKIETGSGKPVGTTDSGSNPNVVDTDNDGFADGLEFFNGADPNSATSKPTFSPDRMLVDLNAASLTDGVLNSWPNSGAMGGTFVAGADAAATVGTVSGAKAVTFGGTNYYNGPVAPVYLTGNASRTVDAWIFNPAVDTEESIIAWGRRGGPDGSNASYIHGTNPTFGAMGQWGAADVGWGSTNGLPAAGQWTYVAYVYDGPTLTATVFKDGALANTKTMAVELNIFATDTLNAPLPFKLGAQNNADSSPGGQLASLSMGRVRVYDHALTPAEIAAKYNAEKAGYPALPASVRITGVSINRTAGTVNLTWVPPTGRAVTVEGSTNLISWSPLATGVTSGQFSEALAGAKSKFYRLRIE